MSDVTPPSDAARPARRRVGIGVALALAVAAAISLPLLLLAPATEEADPPVPPVAAPEGDVDSGPVGDVTGLDVRALMPDDRDPFQQLAVLPDPPPEVAPNVDPGTGEPTTEPPNVDPETGEPTTEPTTQPPGSPGASPPAEGSTGTLGEQSVHLQAVFADDAGVERAEMVIDGTVYTPAEGETFAERFQLARIEDRCVEISEQDERTRLCMAGVSNGK